MTTTEARASWRDLVLALLPALVPTAMAVLWWLAVLFVEVMAARAAKDGRDDWQDLFWPRLLARLDRERFDKLCAHRGQKPPEQT